MASPHRTNGNLSANVHNTTMDYKSSGVDIEAGESLVDRIKPLVKRTRTAGVLSEIGLFGGFFDASFPDTKEPVIVASTDGVGTKLKIAIMSGKYDTIGQCLVNHCVNDILACGAKPIFFMDYFATGRLSPDVAYNVIKGIAVACEENQCALLGGETAEMPSLYKEGEFDVAGTIVGVVEKSLIVNGTLIKSGDVLIGLSSSGLHTNGFSLARNALFPQYGIDDYVEDLGTTISDALLAVHRSYAKSVLPLVGSGMINGLSHITGGGIVGNTSRIMPEGLTLHIEWGTWHIPSIFQVIQKSGGISDEEMRNVYNLGVGMIVVVSPQNVDNVMQQLADESPFLVGTAVQKS